MKWIRFARSLLICTVTAVVFYGIPVYAQLVVPEITINTDQLPEEARTKLAGLDSLLTTYVQAQPWAGDDEQYDFPVQISIFFTDYTPSAQEDKYKAKLIATNKADVRFEDVRWEFGLRQPVSFSPTQYQPFKSVVEFYIWMLLGTEFDKLEKFGGTPYYEKAKQIYLESSSSLYYFGWDKRIDLLRAQTDDGNKPVREFNFFYYTGIYYDDDKDYQESAAYLYYAVLKMDKLPYDYQHKFLESNRRQLADAVGRCRPQATNPDKVKSDMAKALMQIDPEHRDVYGTIAPASGK
jgi:hypothetical protein